MFNMSLVLDGMITEVYFNMWPLSDVLMKVVNNEGKLIL